MEKLVELGITEEEIKDMLELNANLLEENELNILVDILYLLNCDEKIIRHILITNPLYLSRTKEDVVGLINKLFEIGLRNLNLLFDSNPYLLDLDDFDVEDFRIEHNYSNEELANIIEEDPFIFSEV